MSDKAELKKLKKEAELAETASDPIIGDRFPNTYSWGYRVMLVLCSIEETLRNLEQHLADTERTYVKSIHSNGVVYLEHTETITSDSHTQAEAQSDINSDSEISS